MLLLSCIIHNEGIFGESVIKEKWVASIFPKIELTPKNRGDPIFLRREL